MLTFDRPPRQRPTSRVIAPTPVPSDSPGPLNLLKDTLAIGLAATPSCPGRSTIPHPIREANIRKSQISLYSTGHPR